MADDRPRRVCDACGQVDTDPRHVIATAPGDLLSIPRAEIVRKVTALVADDPDGDRILGDLLDTSTVLTHMDCHAALGCDHCRHVVEVSGGKQGAALVKHLTDDKAVAGLARAVGAQLPEGA